MKLHIGKYTNKDLAEWFGVTPNSFNKSKEKKLIELENFAKFHMDGKKVVIDEVYNDTYCKTGSDNYRKVKDKFDEVWDSSGLDSCKRVGDEIYEILTSEDDNFNLANGTVYNYTIRGRNELYGKPFMGEGEKGTCIYTWCKKDEITGKYSFLSPEEQEIKQQLQIKYFGDATEKQVLVKAMIEAGEITREEAWEVLEEMTNMKGGNFMGFLKELQKLLGCQVVKGTYIRKNIGMNNHGIEWK